MDKATLGVLRATAWAPGLVDGNWRHWLDNPALLDAESGEAPALPDLPALSRRRLSRPARLSLQVALDCLNGERADYIVWSSRHGDSAKTVEQLKDIAQGEPLSPTAFSTSVHNAPAGLYSILYADDTPSTSLSAGAESLSQAWWEAAALLHSGQASRVLLVCYDEPSVPPYKSYITQREHPFALALLLSLETNLRLSLSPAPQAGSTADTEALAFWRFYQQETPALAHGRWLWERA